MHDALQPLVQRPQDVHLSLSIVTDSREYRDSHPSTVPTGQMALHQVLPFFHARTKMMTNVTAAIMNVGMFFSHTSLL